MAHGEDGGTSKSTYKSDHASYGRHIEAGSTVLSVTVEQAESQRVMDLLANQVPLKLEDVGTEASATGTRSTTTMTAMREDFICMKAPWTVCMKAPCVKPV